MWEMRTKTRSCGRPRPHSTWHRGGRHRTTMRHWTGHHVWVWLATMTFPKRRTKTILKSMQWQLNFPAPSRMMGKAPGSLPLPSCRSLIVRQAPRIRRPLFRFPKTNQERSPVKQSNLEAWQYHRLLNKYSTPKSGSIALSWTTTIGCHTWAWKDLLQLSRVTSSSSSKARLKGLSTTQQPKLIMRKMT